MLAICLLPVDVGVRRIMVEREQMLKAWNWLLVRVPFLKRKPRTEQRDEAMEALLARKAKVREQVTQQTQPRADLFQPTSAPSPDVTTGIPQPPAGASPTASEPAKPEAPAEEGDYTRKLLEAKKRARKK